MEIVSVKSINNLSDGRVRKEYLLSSPVTSEVLADLSKGDYIWTGYQYLAPTYSITKPGDIVISGILYSPIIVIDCPSGVLVGVEDYLSGFLSTIPDSEEPDSLLRTILHAFVSYTRVRKRTN